MMSVAIRRAMLRAWVTKMFIYDYEAKTHSMSAVLDPEVWD